MSEIRLVVVEYVNPLMIRTKYFLRVVTDNLYLHSVACFAQSVHVTGIVTIINVVECS